VSKTKKSGRTQGIDEAIRAALEPFDELFSPATAVSLALNEACAKANQTHCLKRWEGCTPEEAYDLSLQAAITELQRLRGVVGKTTGGA
jgi:hypothetical protein